MRNPGQFKGYSLHRLKKSLLTKFFKDVEALRWVQAVDVLKPKTILDKEDDNACFYINIYLCNFLGCSVGDNTAFPAGS